MNKEKITPLVITTLLLISTLLVVAYKPIVSGNSLQHTATLSPSITPVPEVTYTFNVTCNSGSVNKTNIILPSGFTKISAQALNDTGNWEFSWVSGTNSYNFSIAAGSPTPNLEANHWTGFRVTVQWPAVPPTTARFGVDAFSQDTASNNTFWLTVTFNPQLSATITPSLVKSNTSYNFNVTVVNLASSAGLGTVNVTYPAGWTFNAIVNYGGSRSWSIVHDASARTFKLSGPNLLANEYFWIQVNMTTQSSGVDPVNWNALAWDISGTFLGTRSLSVTVDGQNPTVTINQPGSGVNYYSVGSGKRIWINGTVSDDLNITKYGVTLTINDTRFERLVYAKGANHLTYNFAFANKTAIQDGKLTVKVTAMDASGRVGSAERSTTIDNSAPQMVYVKALDQGNVELPYVSDVYWMGADTTEIKVKAAFYNPAAPITGRIYLNSTYEVFTNETATSGFNVTGSNYVVLKITLVDSATPTQNNFTGTWEIKRDRVKPSAPTFTVQPICGGAIIRGLTATDNVGVLSFKVYINGTPVTVPLTSLQAQTLTSVGSHRTFSGILVLNLTSYAGETANITIAAVDYGANEGTGVSTLISVPKGTWYPIVLHQKWNLVSLPLIPNNTATSNIYSLILKQDAAGVTVTYGFDNTAKSWVMNPTTMTDGKGYWIYMKAYDVLIVQGLPTPEPPALPTTYHLPAGWCLVGFTETVNMCAHDYVESLEPGSYFRWLYVWDAATQSWIMVDTKEDSSDMLYPGQAFWIYLYTDQDLIPPIP
ncbi:MAG: hypothetical protein QHH12_06860 [Candidatus Bathyarchaeota archaeon]|nr:hypothetical protein [Candidatus Bathyarchaeota archaeon]